MTAAPSVRVVIVLTAMGVRGMTHEGSRPGGPSWSLVAGPAAPSWPRGVTAAAGRAGQRPLPLARPRGGCSAAAGRERDVPGAAAGSARRSRPCPVLPCPPLSGPGAGRLPPRCGRGAPSPARGGEGLVPARPRFPPAAAGSRPGAVRVSVRPGPAEPRAVHAGAGPTRPGRGAGAAGRDNAGRAACSSCPAAACGQTPAERETSAGCGGTSGAAGRGGGDALLEGARDGGGAASCRGKPCQEGASLGEGGS